MREKGGYWQRGRIRESHAPPCGSVKTASASVRAVSGRRHRDYASRCGGHRPRDPDAGLASQGGGRRQGHSATRWSPIIEEEDGGYEEYDDLGPRTCRDESRSPALAHKKHSSSLTLLSTPLGPGRLVSSGVVDFCFLAFSDGAVV